MQFPFEQPHLVDYLQVVWRRKRLFLAYLAMTVITVIVMDHFAQPIFRATAVIAIERDPSRSVLTGQASDLRSAASEELFLNSHYEMMTSRPVLLKVVEALHLDQIGAEQKPQTASSLSAKLGRLFHFLKPDGKEEKSGQSQDEKMLQRANALKAKIIIDPVSNTRLVQIGVEDSDPNMAMEIANTLAKTYIEYDFESNLEATRKMFDLLNEQLLKIRKEMSESQKSIYSLQEKEKILSLEDEQKVQSKNIDELNAQYLKAKTDKMALDARIKELERIANESDYRESISTITESVILQSLYKDLIQAQIQLSQLQEASKTKHPLLEPPEIAETKLKIDLIKKELNKELGRAIETLKVEYAILTNREATLSATLAKLKVEAHRANKVESQLVPLAQEAKTNKELYDLLLVKLKESDIGAEMRQASIRIVEPALLPKAPIRPNKMLNLLIGIIVGLMLGTGSAFFLEYLDRTIRTPMEIKQYLELPLLCTVPKVPIKGRSGKH
jgi:uncharacterized protein involved in exopolysaccharide biosynthesis